MSVTIPPIPDTARVFRWSTPAPNWDGTVPEPWRVSDRSALEAVLLALGYDRVRSYVEHDGGTALWVGLRDNRDPLSHSLNLRQLAELLARQGLRVELSHRDGRVVGMRVLDGHTA